MDDDFQEALRQALERRPAPPSLKRKIMARRRELHQRRAWFAVPYPKLWAQVAAALLMAALAGGGVRWQVEKRAEERRGAEAREQVMTALRITGHALSEAQAKLSARDRRGE